MGKFRSFSPEVAQMQRLMWSSILVIMASSLCVTPAFAECLKSNVEGQYAQGLLSIGRARNAAGQPETPYILRLKSSACVDSKNRKNAVRRVRTIQLIAAQDLRPRLRALAGKEVIVRGSPFTANGFPHHARVVMKLIEIRVR